MERRAYSTSVTQSRLDTGILHLSIDAMTQILLPRFTGEEQPGPTYFMRFATIFARSNLRKYTVTPVGIVNEGLGKNRLFLCREEFGSTSANHVISLLDHEIKHYQGTATELLVNMDNAKVNKNLHVQCKTKKLGSDSLDCCFCKMARQQCPIQQGYLSLPRGGPYQVLSRPNVWSGDSNSRKFSNRTGSRNHSFDWKHTLKSYWGSGNTPWLSNSSRLESRTRFHCSNCPRNQLVPLDQVGTSGLWGHLQGKTSAQWWMANN